jgi:hypothetical protein
VPIWGQNLGRCKLNLGSTLAAGHFGLGHGHTCQCPTSNLPCPRHPDTARLAAQAARAASVAACRALRGRDTNVTVLCPLRGPGALPPACSGAQPRPLVPLGAPGGLRRAAAPHSWLGRAAQLGRWPLRLVCEQIEMRAKLKVGVWGQLSQFSVWPRGQFGARFACDRPAKSNSRPIWPRVTSL